MKKKIRWGILATGKIARKFASDLRLLDGSLITAVGSRKKESAEIFGAEFGISQCHDSYEALAADPDVDVVYIATPHAIHGANALLCLRNGKAVLCEKAFTLNAKEGCEVVTEARARGLFLMEAMWTRFLPLVLKLREMVREGLIGEVCSVTAGFGFPATFNPRHRLFDPALGGGALLDLGIYPLSLAFFLLGPPEEVRGFARLTPSGVDGQSSMMLRHQGGAVSLLQASLCHDISDQAWINGTKGKICLHGPWWAAQALTLEQTGRAPKRVKLPFTGSGYFHEAEEVQHCLERGQTESLIMPLDETLALMEAMDRLRALWGVDYPVR